MLFRSLLLKSPTTIVSDIVIDDDYYVTSPGFQPAELSNDWQHEKNNAHHAYAMYPWFRSLYAHTSSRSAYAIYKPMINVPGKYAVYEWHPDISNAAANVPYEIYYQGGSKTETKTINQKQNYGQWNYLGTYYLNQGTGNYVKIKTEGTTGTVLADAIKFVSLSNNLVNPCNCSYQIKSSQCGGGSCLEFEQQRVSEYVCQPANCDSQPDKTECITSQQCQTSINCDLTAQTGQDLAFEAQSADPDNDQIKYIFDWSDNSSYVSDLVPSNSAYTASHQFNQAGIYSIKVRAQDVKQAQSDWSEPKKACISGRPVTPPSGPPPTNTGDINCDSKVNIYDFGILMSCWENAYDKDNPRDCYLNANIPSNCQGSPDMSQPSDGAVDIIDLGILLSNWTS